MADRHLARRTALGSTVALTMIYVAPATAQTADPDTPPKPADAADVVVVGDRRSVVTDTLPLAALDTRAIAATGATTVAELLRAIRSATQAADGSDPIFLLNAHRVSGYPDIGALPPEAIEKVEVLPEQAALKFGYPPTRRVVNFITKRRFRQIEMRGVAVTGARPGGQKRNANLVLTRLRNDKRLTATLEVRHSAPVQQAQRSIVPDPNVLFDAIGNVTAVDGGEIDPALSAAAGQIVRVAAVPVRAPTLAGFAAGANQPRLFDIGPYRTLTPRNDAVKGETVIAGPIGKTLTGTFSLSAERSRDVFRSGPTAATLLVPADNPFSPFAAPVLLSRYLTEAAPVASRQTTTTLHAGGVVRGTIADWHWDVSAALDQQQTDARNDRGVDVAAANVAIAAGADPFAPLDPRLLTRRLIDKAMTRTRTAGAKAVATGTPLRLPAGDVTLTTTMEAERATGQSVTRGSDPFALRLGRTRIEGAVAIDLPIASRRAGILPFVGEVSFNGSVNGRDVSGFGGLVDATYGATWTPFAGLQLLFSDRHTAIAPPLAQQASPNVRVPNVAVFDYTTGRTEIVTLLQGGNPALAAEHRHVTALTLSLKPLSKSELRLSATYEATAIRNQTGTVYALTQQTEALLPDFVTRDAAGRLTAVTFRPINFYRERQRTLNLTVNASGQIGQRAMPQTGALASFYGGIGPTIKFVDRLQLRPGGIALDLLRGDTVLGSGMPRAQGYAYGGLNYKGNTLTFDAWYGGANRVRSATPAADLSFASIFRLNVGGTIGVRQYLKHVRWSENLQLKLDISNLTAARQIVRDGLGAVPNRFQPDYLDPVGRTVTLTLRKLF